MLSKSSFVSLWLQPFQRHCSAARASVSPHQPSVQSREKVPLPPGKYSHARLHVRLVEGGLDFSPSPGFWFLRRAAASSPRHPTTTTPSPHSGQEGLSWESWHQRLPSLFPSPSLSKPNKNKKCTPSITPSYSEPEVYTASRALGDLPQYGSNLSFFY